MLISRIYNTSADAAAAISDLTEAGFREEAIQVTDATSAGLTEADLVTQGILPENAGAYISAIAKGATLLIVEAPIGAGQRASDVLEVSRAGDTGTPAAVYEAATRPDVATTSQWTGAAPLSERFGWRVLSDDTSAKKTSSFGLPLLWGGASPLSDWLGIKLLSDTPHPLSTWLNKKMLTDDPTPLSTWLGRKVLSDDPTPLSNWIGKGVLIDNPTPLSSKLNIRVLSDDPAPARKPAPV
jgi:hypothetical protein